MNRFLFLVVSLLVASCSDYAPPNNREFDVSSGAVDLSKEISGDWDRVCFITPYMDNKTAKKVLGFEFDVQSKSGIYALDGITLLITVKNNEVMEYFETPRDNIDFSSLKAGCYERGNAKFVIERDGNGWPYVKNT